MAGLVDMPTSWEQPSATKDVIMQDERNFERSTPNWAISYPRDMNLAEDKGEEKASDFVKQVQKIMKSGPLGSFPYTGPIDGLINDHLLYTVIQFGWKIRDRFGKSIQMVSGRTISPTAFNEAMGIIGEKKEKLNKEDETEDKEEKDKVIASFQKYFKANGMYSGSTDGEPTNDELVELGNAAKNIEKKLAAAIANNSIIGKLWDDKNKKFLTSVEDLQSALKMVMQNKKAAIFDQSERIKLISNISANK